MKVFADDTSLFSVVCDSNISVYELNNDMQKISEWAYKWKMSFNPDLNKQAQEVIFSWKLNKSSHPKIFFNNAPVFCANWQKHLGMYLDETLNFNLHINEKMSKALKGIGIIRKLSKRHHGVLRRFKPCSWCVRDSQWRGSLTMVPAGNKVMCTR